MSITSNHFANLKAANLIRLKTNEAATEQITTEQIENAKKQGQAQLQSSFPQTTNNPKSCGSRGVNVIVDGKSFFVKGTPKYIHNINEGTYSLQSVEYTVSENKNGMTQVVTGEDYLNNIIENKAIGNNTNVQDLQKELSDLMKKIKNKTEALRKLFDKISGNGNLIASIGFEAVDTNSPNAVSTSSKHIEEATKKLAELDKEIQNKTTEYHQKTEFLWQAKNKAKELDAEFEKNKQLLNDLCEHYGINTSQQNFGLMGMEAPKKQDLDNLLDYYKKYQNMQQDNINKLIDAIKDTKGDSKDIDISVAKTPDDKSGTEYLGSLKNKAKSIDEKFKKTMQLYKDLCNFYGADFNKMYPINGMEAPTNTDTAGLTKYYENYLQMQKENIEKINNAIDKLQKPNTDRLEIDLDKLQRAHSLFIKSRTTFGTNK